MLNTPAVKEIGDKGALYRFGKRFFLADEFNAKEPHFSQNPDPPDNSAPQFSQNIFVTPSYASAPKIVAFFNCSDASAARFKSSSLKSDKASSK